MKLCNLIILLIFCPSIYFNFMSASNIPAAPSNLHKSHKQYDFNKMSCDQPVKVERRPPLHPSYKPITSQSAWNSDFTHEHNSNKRQQLAINSSSNQECKHDQYDESNPAETSEDY